MISNKPHISIVIPVYNGARTISGVVDELMNTLNAKYRLEIVLVNDNSPDNSEEVCIQLFEKYINTVRFYSLSKNVGEHNAVMAGLNHINGDYVVIMDDDFQNPISEVDKLIATALESDFDVIYTYYEKKKHSLFRNIGSMFNDRVANVMLQKPKKLYLSSFKIINHFIAREIIKYRLPYPYIDGLILRITDNISQIRVDHHSRDVGKSGYTLKKLISLWLNMFVNFSILPLRVSIIMGFIFSLFGLILGLITFIEKLANPNLPIGWATLVVSVSIFSGIQLVAIGIIGEYVGRVFLSQNKKPQYTIRKSFENVRS
jgi:undecaprenyl-phosphate 4-deoxy-4-formamido-L-arabinose transferase